MKIAHRRAAARFTQASASCVIFCRIVLADMVVPNALGVAALLLVPWMKISARWATVLSEFSPGRVWDL